MSQTTIKDIARECGCSVSTVSRALNNHPDINPETRKKIMEVISRTGFVPNNSAIQLKKSDQKNIALLVKGITNQFFNLMIRNMEDYIARQNFATILRHVAAEEDEVQVALQLIKEKKLRGIIFLGGNFTHDENTLRQLGIPFVFCTIGIPASMNGKAWYASVSVDDRKEAARAVDYLIGLGHRRIAFLGDQIAVPSVGKLRYEGYCDALAKHGIRLDPSLVLEVTDAGETGERYTMKNGYDVTASLLDSGADITAVFCIADVFAIGACRAILERGKKIPDDISAVGYDGIDIGNYYYPSLTTIRQPTDQMARTAIELLFGMINEERKPEVIFMPAELVVRESSGKCRK